MNAKQFVFATCGATENAWLKREVTRCAPHFHLAFSCPGFVTWRVSSSDGPAHGKAAGSNQVTLGTTELCAVGASAVARVSGVSLGKVATPEELPALLAEVRSKLHGIHVFVVDSAATRESAAGTETQSELDQAQVLATWRAAAATLFPEVGANPSDGALVADVMLEPNGRFAWLGYHVKSPYRPSAAGGVTRCLVPEYAPSRAYAKVVELLNLAELTPVRGWRAVELGAAPGGGTLALLERGVNVVAIDPAPLNAEVIERATGLGASLTLLQKAAAEVTADEVPRAPELLITDVNLAPSVSLNYIEKLAKLSRGPKQAILMTWKINDEKVENSLPELLARTRSIGERFGLGRMRFVHLPSHRREIGVTLSR